MTPAARLQAAIEVLDEVIAAARDEGPPADAIVTRYFKTRRYAGSKDRRAVRELVFRAIRRSAERPENGRSAVIGLASEATDLLPLFGEPRGPEPRQPHEAGAAAGLVPEWLKGELSPLVDEAEWPSLLERAPVDLRANAARTSRDQLLPDFPGAVPTPLSPWGIRLPPDCRVDDHAALLEGLAEVQDEGSQLIALACPVRDGMQVIDLCAGAGGKSLALAATAPAARILATDTNRSRLARLAPRAERAGASVETRLLNPKREREQLADCIGAADVVLVDAPCSGSGTWRRNPEGRWRLTLERLHRLTALQAELLDLGADMVRPGGELIYGVCSLLRREGSEQVDRFLSRRSSFMAQETLEKAGRLDGVGRLLTPAHDGTDGFFIARLTRAC